MFDLRRFLPAHASGAHRLPPLALGIVAAAVGLAALGGDIGPSPGSHLDRREATLFRVIDEAGRPVRGATFNYLDRTRVTGGNGMVGMKLREPVAGVVTADGKLDEPVTLAPGDDQQIVMFDRVGADGTPRVVMHFGGDVMLGRRYQQPMRAGTPVVDDPASARALVSDIAPIARAADLTVANVETIVGDYPVEEALPGKKYLLQSSPAITDMLLELGVDVGTLGNNHIYDWGQPGVDSTLEAFEPTGIVTPGVGETPEEALRGALVPVVDELIGLISVTSINVDFVNDRLPTAEALPPDDLDPSEAWQYEERSFGYAQPGDAGYMATRDRRAGPAWRMFVRRAESMPEPEMIDLHRALLEVYPELSDWVARRGHGGAGGYDRQAVADEIERLRSVGADRVVVQFHAGFQFSTRPTDWIQGRSREAIDDGADFVISHHPHVIQGFEWHGDGLIAYSLGNFVFDQNFHATYPSMLLRLVVDDSGIVEARAIPMMLDDYRPVPVAGDAAARIVRMLDVRSSLDGTSARVDGLEKGIVLAADSRPAATVRLDRNHGVVQRERDERTMAVTLDVDDAVEIPVCRSMRVDNLPASVEYGVDRLGWGAIDDATADWKRRSPMHWVVRSPLGDGPTLGAGVSGDATDDAIQITASSSESAFARTVSRIPITEHRWWSAPKVPVDRPPRFALEFDGRRTGGADGTVMLRAFHFTDVDPTRYPVSASLAELEVPIGLTEHDEWQHIEIPLDELIERARASSQLSVDVVLVTFRTPRARHQEFRFDNVKLMEWRRSPETEAAAWEEVDALRSDVAVRFGATVAGCVDD